MGVELVEIKINEGWGSKGSEENECRASRGNECRGSMGNVEGNVGELGEIMKEGLGETRGNEGEKIIKVGGKNATKNKGRENKKN